jgi:chromosome segregation ATPase
MTEGFLKKRINTLMEVGEARLADIDRLNGAIDQWREREESLMADRYELRAEVRELSLKLSLAEDLTFRYQSLANARLMDLADLRGQLTVVEDEVSGMQDLIDQYEDRMGI